MSFTEAISSGFRNYATFGGRARRSAYWWWALFAALVGTAAGVVDSSLGLATETGGGPLTGLVSLALLLPGLAVGARRLHDTGRSGFWLLMLLVPVAGPVVLLVFFVLDSQPGPNKYGPNPKEPAAAQDHAYGYGAAGQDPRYGTPS